jgi:hypothetical protein
LKNHPKLRVEISLKKPNAESQTSLEERRKAVTEYLSSNWQVAPERITFVEDANAAGVRCRVFLPE